MLLEGSPITLLTYLSQCLNLPVSVPLRRMAAHLGRVSWHASEAQGWHPATCHRAFDLDVDVDIDFDFDFNGEVYSDFDSDVESVLDSDLNSDNIGTLGVRVMACLRSGQHTYIYIYIYVCRYIYIYIYMYMCVYVYVPRNRLGALVFVK